MIYKPLQMAYKMQGCHSSLSQVPAGMEHNFCCTSNIKLYNSIYSTSNYAKAFLMMELLPTCNANDLQAAPNDHMMHPFHSSVSQVPAGMEHNFCCTSNIKLYNSI